MPNPTQSAPATARTRTGTTAVGWSLFLACLAAAAACQRGPRPLAVIGERTLTFQEISEDVIAETGRTPEQASPELVAALFESRLEEEILLAADLDEVGGAQDGSTRGARARALLARLCPPPSPVDDADVEAALARRGGSTPVTRLRLRQLILPDRATADKARERIRRGEDFEALSRELSRAANADTGGTIGWVERGQLPPEFEAVVLGLGPGETGEPVASNAGWHVFQVVERTTGLDDAGRQRVRAELESRAAHDARRQCLRSLAVKVKVQVNCEGAPFPCRNPYEEKP